MQIKKLLAITVVALVWTTSSIFANPPQRLTPNQVSQALTQLNGWRLRQGKLHKSFQFPDFVSAFGFMTQVAILSEQMGHHPEWFNVYNRITIDLVTHDAGGISNLDIELAQKIDRLYPPK